MSPPLPTAPAWYPDPEDPVRLRHWNGRGWDPRRRTLPAWALATDDLAAVGEGRRDSDPVLEGPAHPAGLKATAAAAAQSAHPRPRGISPGRVVAGRGTSGTGTSTAGRMTGMRPVRRASWSRPRAVLMSLSALIGLAVLVLAATVGIAPRPAGTTTLAQDATFIQTASIDCAAAMGAIRLTPQPSMSSSGTTPTPSPEAVAAANLALERLETRIRALPVTNVALNGVQGWLDTWNRFAADRMKQADAAAARSATGSATGTTSVAAALGPVVSLDAAQADAFATTNGLGNCALDADNAPLTHS